MSRLVAAAAVATVTFWLSGSVLAADTADVIYSGGPIYTMNDALPKAEAVAVKDGKILAVGTSADVMKLKGDGTVLQDLKGQAMVPGFVDAHSHVYGVGVQALSANLLAPPDGNVKNIPDLIQTLKDWAAANKDTVQKVGIIIGFGYDEATLAEHRPPTAAELDAGVDRHPRLCRPPVRPYRRRQHEDAAACRHHRAIEEPARRRDRAEAGHQRA